MIFNIDVELSLKWRLAVACGSIIFCCLIAYNSWLLRLKKKAYELCGHHVYFAPTKPLLGNALDLVSLKSSTECWEFVTEVSNKHPQGILLWLFHIPWLFVQELDVVEVILTSTETVEKSHVYRLLDTITDGVFTAESKRWKKLRRKLNLTFSQRQIDLIYPDVNEQIAICIDVLKKNVNKHINIMSFMTTFFFDTVSRTHFGIHTNEQIQREIQITEIAAKIIELTMENRVFKPQNHILPIFKTTRVSGFIDHMRNYPLVYIRNMVKLRQDEAKLEVQNSLPDEKKRIFYVDVVKEAMEEMNIETSVYNVERNTSDMLIAASDTTSIAVSAVFFYLATYPEIQQKVYEEVIPIFGESSCKELTKDDLNKMEYLEMVIKETLRHTAPPGIIRELPKDLNVGKYTIPKNTNVYLILKSIHKNPLYWEKPTDFYPEHFLPEKVKTRPKYAYLPFSAGPRNCPGMAYSYVTMKSIISSVIRNFILETNIPLKDIRYKMILMQEHKNGYYMKLKPRMN